MVLIAELIRGVDRREEIVGAIVAAGLALLIVTGVGYQLHVVMLKADTCLYAKLSEGQRGRNISCTESVMSTIIVSHLQLLEHIEAVSTHILLVAQQRRDVNVLEIGRKRVGSGVPLIIESTRTIFPCAIFTVAAHLQGGIPTGEVERVSVVNANGEDMLIELCPFAGYVVAGMQGYVAGILHIVEEVSPTVRQTAVGIRIPDTPIKGIASEGMLSC